LFGHGSTDAAAYFDVDMLSHMHGERKSTIGTNFEPSAFLLGVSHQRGKIENKTLLLQSFYGSSCHLLSLTQNSSCLVSDFGFLTLFIT